MGELSGIAADLRRIAAESPQAAALRDQHGHAVDFGNLVNLLDAAAYFYSGAGIQTGSRIAAVINDGMSNALSFLAITETAAFVPLNPDFSKEQFLYYFRLLNVTHLLVGKQEDSHAAEAADELDIPIIKLSMTFDDAACGSPAVEWRRAEDTGKDGASRNDGDAACGAGIEKNDTALILCTSGTTATPKVIALTHSQLYDSAVDRIGLFEMKSSDCCLLVTPFYRSVTINSMLAALLAGGSAICSGRFEPADFFRILQKGAPTWFTASPAVLRAALDYAEKAGIERLKTHLRFLRSSGASLHESLYEALKAFFGVPVVVTYGLTETRMIASTYNAPCGHKPGSVGIPAKAGSIMISDSNGDAMDCGQTGEIVVRGVNIFKGYENREQNEDLFFGEWFRTGDQGYIDEDGYLFINGRIKEVINRGGEKISPFEVEQAILSHPDIEDAVVFKIQGIMDVEEVGAAVVMKTGAVIDIFGLRKFLRDKIVAFKMPSVLYVTDEIPVGAEGKVQRGKLQTQLTDRKAKEQRISDRHRGELHGGLLIPQDELEKKLERLWKKILKVRQIGNLDSFTDLGGDSLRAALLIAEIEDVFGKRLPMQIMAGECTFRIMADALRDSAGGSSPFLVTLEKEGSKPPLFIVHGGRGVITNFHRVAAEFKGKRPVCGLWLNKSGTEWEHPVTIEQIAAAYVRDIFEEWPNGPYNLAGHCIGGVIACEMAGQMMEQGAEIASLILIDPIVKGGSLEPAEDDSTMAGRAVNEFRNLPPGGFEPWIRFKIRRKLLHIRNKYAFRIYHVSKGKISRFIFGFAPVQQFLSFIRKKYKYRHYHGKIHYLVPEQSKDYSERSIAAWKDMADKVSVHRIGGSHSSMLSEVHTASLAKTIDGCMEEDDRTGKGVDC